MSAIIIACLQVDLVKKEGASAQQQMIRVAEQLNGLHSFQQTFWVSALRAQGMTKLKDFLTQRCEFPLTSAIHVFAFLNRHVIKHILLVARVLIDTAPVVVMLL